jgi:hypothetical protein
MYFAHLKSKPETCTDKREGKRNARRSHTQEQGEKGRSERAKVEVSKNENMY